LDPIETDGKVNRTPPIATWFDRSGVEPRAAWLEVKDFLPQKWLAPLRVRAGGLYVYGPGGMHRYWTVVGRGGQVVRGTVHTGSIVPDYTINPDLPKTRALASGGSFKFDLRDLPTPIPITLGFETLHMTEGTNTEGSNHNQIEADWRPRRDIALIATA